MQENKHPPFYPLGSIFYSLTGAGGCSIFPGQGSVLGTPPLLSRPITWSQVILQEFSTSLPPPVPGSVWYQDRQWHLLIKSLAGICVSALLPVLGLQITLVLWELSVFPWFVRSEGPCCYRGCLWGCKLVVLLSLGFILSLSGSALISHSSMHSWLIATSGQNHFSVMSLD